MMELNMINLPTPHLALMHAMRSNHVARECRWSTATWFRWVWSSCAGNVAVWRG